MPIVRDRASSRLPHRLMLTGQHDRAIDVRGLGKRFGIRWVLRGVTLAVRAGETVGLLGPNGSGKSTVLRIVGTLIKASVGTRRGQRTRCHSRRRRGVRGQIGYLAHTPGLYDDLTARENLTFAADMLGLPHAAVDAPLERVGLAHVADDRVRGFSAGMQRRLALARLILRNPRVLLLRRAVRQSRCRGRRAHEHHDRHHRELRRCGARGAARARASESDARPHVHPRRRTHRRRGPGGRRPDRADVSLRNALMGWRDDWRRVRAIARKDLTTELRAKAGFNGVASLGVTILILLGLALGPDAAGTPQCGRRSGVARDAVLRRARVQSIVPGRDRDRARSSSCFSIPAHAGPSLRGSCSAT